MLDQVSETNSMTAPSPKRVRCLACLDWVAVGEECECGAAAPPVRYRYYHFEPLALPLLGAPDAGKTSYLDAMLSLVPRLTRVWPRFAFSPATEHTRDRYRRALRTTTDGALPQPTSALALTEIPQPPERAGTSAAGGVSDASATPSAGDLAATSVAAIPPVTFLMHGLPNRWQLERRADGVHVHRALSLHDTPGKDSQPLRLPVERLKLLRRSRRSLMFFSLPEIEQHGSEHLSLLFDSYTETLVARPRSSELSGEPELIVVFTQAECAHSLPPQIWNYLLKDPLWTFLAPHASRRRGQVVFDDLRLSEYLQGMKLTHDFMAEWLVQFDGGSNFIRLARDYGVTLYFTVVSSTGAQPQNSRVIGGWQPHRVLDPLFWALELDQRERKARASVTS